ncbi:putative serine protease K12H4.7 [Clytia hemisphaerica]|uniref:Serine protease n=1 Tax=Clytia hemisphaerica TaxID=252671 RepID=A0A7M5UWQ8_9CNID
MLLVISFIACTISTIQSYPTKQSHVPYFHKGRPKGGFLGDPYIDPRQNFKAAEPQWYTQQLNHFDDQDTRTWQQKYYVNATQFGENGPVFLMIGGEGPLSARWVGVGSMVEMAKEHKALVLALEHRYYGDSHPTSDTSVENLKYLSSEQALADLATFRASMVEQFALSDKNKWISFGGSYPGALSAWFRYKYPHLVHGAVASSAPINAQTDFPEYLEVSTDSLGTQECKDSVQAATTSVEKYVQTEAGRKMLTDLFHLCEPLSDDPNDISQFTSSMAGNFFGVIQYNKDNRAFEGATGTNITVDTLCNIMSLPIFGDEMHRYAKINEIMMETYKQTCISPNYKKFIEEMKVIDWKSVEGGRQWTYQTCTEFGYYQSSDSKSQVYGTTFPLSFWTKQCVDIFGANFNETSINRAVDWTNDNYGGYNMNQPRIVFPNGSIDPWHALSFTDDHKDMIAVFIKGTAHCANMYPSSEDDSQELQDARQKIHDLVGKWLQEE